MLANLWKYAIFTSLFQPLIPRYLAPKYFFSPIIFQNLCTGLRELMKLF